MVNRAQMMVSHKISPIVATMSSSSLVSPTPWGSLLERLELVLFGVGLCFFFFRETSVVFTVFFEATRDARLDSIRETKSSSEELSGQSNTDEGLGMVDEMVNTAMLTGDCVASLRAR